MDRAYDSDVLLDEAGNCIVNALGTLYTDAAHTTLVTDNYTAETGGSLSNTVTTDAEGRWIVHMTTPKSYWVRWADNMNAAYAANRPTVLLDWTTFTSAEHQAFEKASDEVTDDALVVHLAGAETISGAKTFTHAVTKAALLGTNAWESMPYLAAAIRDQNDTTPTTLRVIGLGSSVGLGSGTDGPGAAGAPSKVFCDLLTAKIDLLGNLAFAHTNGSVNGHAMGDLAADYAAAKTAAGGVPIVVTIAMGMNDGGGGQYFRGNTLRGIKKQLHNIINAVRADGADVVIWTSPHPNTSTYSFADAGPYTYPGTYIPNTTQAKLTADWADTGVTFAQSYRHFRVNEAMRATALERGVALVDAERYWFEAVASLGNDALYNPVETVHPNTLGHQQSYGIASADFVDRLTRPSLASANHRRRIIGQEDNATTSGGTVTISIPAATSGVLTLRASSGGSWPSIRQLLVTTDPNGAAKVAVGSIGTAFLVSPGDAIASVAGSTSSLDVTVTMTATGTGGDLAWTYEYVSSGGSEA